MSERDCSPLTFASHAYDDFHLLMPLWQVTSSHRGTVLLLACLRRSGVASLQSNPTRAAMRQCVAWSGEAHGREGQQLAWVATGNLERYSLLPADAPLLPAVQAAVAQYASMSTLGI